MQDERWCGTKDFCMIIIRMKLLTHINELKFFTAYLSPPVCKEEEFNITVESRRKV